LFCFVICLPILPAVYILYLSLYTFIYCIVSLWRTNVSISSRVELGLHATLCFDGQVEEKLQMLRQAIKRQTDILVQVHYRWQQWMWKRSKKNTNVKNAKTWR